MSHVYVMPVPGRVVTLPAQAGRPTHVPPHGLSLVADMFIQRCLLDGDLVLGVPPWVSNPPHTALAEPEPAAQAEQKPAEGHAP